jgi:hypothetical protein
MRRRLNRQGPSYSSGGGTPFFGGASYGSSIAFYIDMPNRPGRLKGFEYVGFVTYFVTICTEKHLRAFDDVDFGRWAVAQLLRQASLRKFEVSAYCLMPDHVHLLSGQVR